MKNLKAVVRRSAFFAAAGLLAVGVTLPSMLGQAHAAQITTRSIQMSSSKPGDTGVSYQLTFTPSPSGNASSLIVDFCDDTPLIGATCNFTSTSVPDVSSAATSTGGATLTKPTSHTIEVTGLTITGGSQYTITFTGITNPSTNPTAAGTFYARVLTYSGTNAGNYVPAATTGSATTVGTGNVDSGGVALSTASEIDITARVMEQISFCVYTTTCGDATSLELGTGSPKVIDSATVYTGSLNFSLSSNASSGVKVYLKGDTLKSGTNSIAAAGASAVTFAAGTANFGVSLPNSTAGSVGVVDADANYDNTGTKYGLDTTNTTSTYGDIFANTNSAPLNGAVVPFTYAATASLTTPAGIYTATHQLIATGTF